MTARAAPRDPPPNADRERAIDATPLILAALLGAAIVHRRSRLSRGARAAGGLACLALVAAGAGLIDPPPLEQMIRSATSTLGDYAYPLVGVGALLETGAGVGLIVPGDLLVMLGGVSAGQGQIDIVLVIAIVWVCALAGDLTSYLLGRRLGRPFLLRHGPAIGITEGRLERVEHHFTAHGGKTIVIGRFIGLVKALAPFIAGASRMPARRFVPYTTLAAGVWATTFSLLGYAFWQSLDQLIAITKQGSIALGAVAAIGLGAVVVLRRLRSRPSARRPRGREPVKPDAAWTREPWRNGTIEHFNDTFDRRFFRQERFSGLEHLTERADAFERCHNAQHRYSATRGQTPDETTTAATRTPVAPAELPAGWPTQGKVEFIRLSASSAQSTSSGSSAARSRCPTAAPTST